MDIDNDEGFEDLEQADTESEGQESIEDSIVAAFQEVDDKEAGKEVEKEATQEEEKEESTLTKAARELANAKRKGKQTYEAKDLNLGTKPQKQQALVQQEEVLHPPQRWTLEKKEEFNKLPPIAKKEVLDFWNGIEGHSTKLFQEVNRQKQELGSTLDVIQRYERDWHSQGFTTPQMLAELAGTREMLRTKPMESLDLLHQKLGITPEQLYEYRQQRESGQPAQRQQLTAQQFDESKYLTIDKLPQILQNYQQQSIAQQEYQNGVNGVQEMVNEVQGGRYVWPELHDNLTIERLKPLADSFKKTQPSITWAEATKQAIAFDRFQKNQGQGSPSFNSARLPTQQPDIIQRARQASAASVRGRGNPQIAAGKLPENESIEDSLRAVFGNNNSY